MKDIEKSVEVIKKRKVCDLCLEERCKKDCEHSLGYSFSEIEIAFDDAIEALKKQMPRKPVLSPCDEFNGLFYTCPCCGDTNMLMSGDNFCTQCGQALDWNKTEKGGAE